AREGRRRRRRPGEGQGDVRAYARDRAAQERLLARLARDVIPLRRRPDDRPRSVEDDRADDERERQGVGEALSGREAVLPGGAAAGGFEVASFGFITPST